MAKGSGKKLKDKGQTIRRIDANKKMKKKKKVSKVEATNAVPPAPVSPQAHASAANGSTAASGGRENAKDELEGLSGFIFMCNAKTKPECFRYRVFGLPAGRREDVEKVKADMKLFLFDFDLKLLYGVYKASCHGQMNLETSAFGGRFPAQVSFEIYKECLPLPETAFRLAIRDNYQGSKFKPELSGQQVRDLLSLFRPCAALTAAPVTPMPQVAPSQAIRPSPLEDQFQLSIRLPPARMQHGLAAPMVESHPVQRRVLSSQHELYGTAATMGPTLEHQGLPASNNHYYQPYLAEGTSQIVQDQYPRYRAVQEMVPRDQFVGSEREYYQLPLQREREFDMQRDNVAAYYPTYPMPATAHKVAGYYTTYPTPATSHDPPLMHPHGTYTIPATTYDPPLRHPHGTYPMPATSQGPPLMHPHGTYSIPATSHGPPLMHPHGQVSGRPEMTVRNDPVSSYYSFAGAKLLYR